MKLQSFGACGLQNQRWGRHDDSVLNSVENDIVYFDKRLPRTEGYLKLKWSKTKSELHLIFLWPITKDSDNTKKYWIFLPESKDPASIDTCVRPVCPVLFCLSYQPAQIWINRIIVGKFQKKTIKTPPSSSWSLIKTNWSWILINFKFYDLKALSLAKALDPWVSFAW